MQINKIDYAVKLDRVESPHFTEQVPACIHVWENVMQASFPTHHEESTLLLQL